MTTSDNRQILPMAQAAPPETSMEKEPAQLDYETGVRHLSEKDHSQAANAFHNAIVGFEQSDNQTGLANACDKLGDVCLLRGEHDKAFFYYERAFQICQEFDDLFSLLSLRKKLAASHRHLRRHGQAIGLYLDMLAIYEKINNPAGSVDVLTAIGETYEEMGQPGKAADAFATAASIHANFGHARQAEELQKRADTLNGHS